MKALFIGGTGNISAACSKLALEKGIDLYILNRATEFNNLDQFHEHLKGELFDVVVNFIAFTPGEMITESTLLSNPFWNYSRDKIACEELLIKTFREGIKRAFEWFDEDPSRIRIDERNNQLIDTIIEAYRQKAK